MLYLEIIKNHYTSLTKSEKNIANALLNREIDVLSVNSLDVAKHVGVSLSLINKFCMKIGLTGWKELKGIAVASLASSTSNLIDSKKPIQEKINFLINVLIQSEGLIDKKIDLIVKKIQNSKRVIFVANGATYDLCKLTANKLKRIGYNSYTITFNTGYWTVLEDDYYILSTISGYQKKIKDVLSNKNIEKNSCLITLGKYNKPKILNISLDVYNKLSLREKALPISTDIGFLVILNKILDKLVDEVSLDKYKNNRENHEI